MTNEQIIAVLRKNLSDSINETKKLKRQLAEEKKRNRSGGFMTDAAIKVVPATSVDYVNREATCPCGTRISLPGSNGPVLRDCKKVWLPVLVAVRCPSCKAEVRLEGTK